MVLLGTPSVADPFHHERWDYTATQRIGRIGKTEIKNLTLWFEGDSLAKLGRRILPRAGRRHSRNVCLQAVRTQPAEGKGQEAPRER